MVLLYGQIETARYRTVHMKSNRLSTFLDVTLQDDGGTQEYLLGWTEFWRPDERTMTYLEKIIPGPFGKNTQFRYLVWYWKRNCGFDWASYNDPVNGIYYPVPVLIGREL